MISAVGQLAATEALAQDPDIELLPGRHSVKVTVISAEGPRPPEDTGRRRLPSATELLNRM